MFKRLWHAIRSWFGGGLDKLEDPELLLTLAKQEMASAHFKNRDRAVQAITAKNNLQKMVRQLEEKLKQLERAAAEAEGKPDSEAARNLRREAAELRRMLEEAQQSLAEAIATAEEVKRSIRDEEMKIRRRMTERMAWKALHKNSAIESEIRRQLRAIGLWDDRQQVPPPEMSPREMLIALAVCLFYVVVAVLLLAWLRTY